MSRPVFSACRRRSSSGVSADPGDVEVLPADHAVDPGRAGQLARGGQHVRRLAGLLAEEVAEGLGVEPVAREDRDVLAELHVAGRPAAAQLVVVHRRQVVVDQRVGVDELDRGGQRQHARRARGRSPARWRARAPGGCACRRPAASSASPPPGRRSAARRWGSAGRRGSARPRRAGRPGRRSPTAGSPGPGSARAARRGPCARARPRPARRRRRSPRRARRRRRARGRRCAAARPRARGARRGRRGCWCRASLIGAPHSRPSRAARRRGCR